MVSFGKAAVLVEVVENGGMDGDEFLQTSHSPKALHRPFSSSERQMRALTSVVQPKATGLPVLAPHVAKRGFV
jgi:hypothetical protein